MAFMLFCIGTQPLQAHFSADHRDVNSKSPGPNFSDLLVVLTGLE